jgi:tetratricopeptide (TPR) repeat protein
MIFEHAPKLIGNFVPGASVISAFGSSLTGGCEKKIQAEAQDSLMNGIDESKIQEQYIDLLRAITEKYNLVLVLDHLEWLDTASVHLWEQLVRGLSHCPVMVIGCFRSADIDMDVDGRKHPFQPFLTEMKIDSRSSFVDFDKESESGKRDFMNAMLDAEPNAYSSDFREKLFQRTMGNPLFVSGMVELLREQGALKQNDEGKWAECGELRWDTFPVSIEGIIQERIGHLKSPLEVFSKFNFSSYIFQTYYQKLSPTERMLLHNDVADQMAERFKDNIESVAGDIAHHYELAEDYESAAKYSKIAITSMMRAGAFEEAEALCRKAISMLEDCGAIDDEERLYFMAQICECERAVIGWGNEKVLEMHNEARKLAEQCGDTTYYPSIMYGINAVHLTRLEFENALEICKSLYEWAREHEDKNAEMQAMSGVVNNLFWLGRLREACDMARPYTDSEDGENLNLFIISVFDMLAAELIDRERGDALFRKTEQRTEASKNPFYKTLGCHVLSWYAYFADNDEKLEKYGKLEIDYAQKYNFRYYDALGDITYGAWVAKNNFEAGIKLMDDGWELLKKQQHVEIPTGHSFYHLMKARALFDTGKTEEAAKFLDAAFPVSEAHKEFSYIDKMYQLRGKCCEVSGNAQEAETWYGRAREAADRLRN